VEHGSCSMAAAVVDTNMGPLVDEWVLADKKELLLLLRVDGMADDGNDAEVEVEAVEEQLLCGNPMNT